MSYEEWVRRKIQKRDIKGLVKELKNEDRAVRKAVAKSLDKLGWEPSNDAERINYLIAAEEWDGLAEMGKPAVKSLTSCLEDKELDIRVNVARTLGEIGDAKAIKPLLLSPYPMSTDESIWKYYNPLVPVVADALASIGKPAIEQFIKAVKDYGASGHPAIWALCQIGDRKATEAVVDWIFELGPVAAHLGGFLIVAYDNKPVSSVDLIRTIIPPKVLPKLLGDYTDLILDIFAWRPTSEPEKSDVSRCHEAIQRLCMIKTPVSSNILHKVTKIGSLTVSSEWGVEFHTVRYLDFKSERKVAGEELKRRGKPRYDPSVYLNQDAWRL